MSVIGVVAAKGSPGVTTLAVAMVLARPGEAVLVEADQHGGDLALLHAVPQSPGLTQLAARARRTGTDPDALGPYVRPLADGALPVVLAPVDGAAVRAALNVLADHPGLLETGEGRTVVFDLGRIEPEGAGWMWLSACDRVLLVARTDLTALAHTAVLAQRLRERDLPASLALIDTGPYPPGEAEQAVGLPLAGTVPFHPKQARALLEPAAIRRARAGRLVSHASTLLNALTRQPVEVSVR